MKKQMTQEELLALLDDAREHILCHSNSKNRMDLLLDYCPLFEAVWP